MKARLVKIRPETDNITSFILEPEKTVNRKAGQFLRYVLPHSHVDERGNDRYFTVASAPYEKYIQITTRFASQSSSFKQALKQLPIGGEIQVDSEPEGEFVITDFTRNYIFVVGGIGITPIRSILAEADHIGEHIKAHVLYGTDDEPILFKQDLDRFARNNPELHVEYVRDPKKNIERALQGVIKQVDEPYVYITGPEPMVESFAVIVKKMGLNIGHIQTDFFTGYDHA
ncbi:MAG: FAD-dependent oxidoreductase [Candidatus Saccharibacteria bacterium]